MKKFYFIFLLFTVTVNSLAYSLPQSFVAMEDGYYIFCLISYVTLLFLSTYNKNEITALLVFQAPFGLFILGRFIGHYLDSGLKIESIDFFHSVNLSSQEIIRYLSIYMIFFNMVFMGYLLPPLKARKASFKLEIDSDIITFFSYFIIFISIIGIFLVLKDLYSTVSQFGYAALYIVKKENANDSSSIFITLLLVTIGLAAKENCRRPLNILMIVLFSYSFALLFMGARGPMMTYIILWLWLYKKNINIIKLGVVALIILACVQYLSAMMRTTDSQYNIFAKILYDMGTTFIVLPFGSFVSDWPNVALIQNFIPMASRLASLFIDFNPYEANLANYLGFHLNQDLYWKGVGLGWTVVLDFSIYALGNIILLSLYAMIFGIVLRNLDSFSSTNTIKYGLATTVILPLSFLYRSGLFSVVPLAVYFLMMILILSFISTLFRRINFGN
ncbi:O-antigen polysaccharide polymerase Wzy [Huaxiibacter chinensis]